MKKEYFATSYLIQDLLVSSGPSGIRTHDLSNANAVSYRTRRSAHVFDSDLDINIFRLIMFL